MSHDQRFALPENQKVLSRDLVAQVRLHQGAQFVASGEYLLHSIVNITAHGILDNKFGEIRDQMVDELMPLGSLIRELVNRGDVVLNALQQLVAKREEALIITKVESELLPLLDELEGAVDRIYQLNLRAIDQWLKVHDVFTNVVIVPAGEDDDSLSLYFDPNNPKDVSNIYVSQHEDEYRRVKRGFAKYRFDPTLNPLPLAANQLLLELFHTCRPEVEFSDRDVLIMMTPAHLDFVCSKVCCTLIEVASALREAVVAEMFSNDAFFEIPPDEVEQSDSYARIIQSLFGNSRLKARISGADDLVIAFPAPTCLQADWQGQLPALASQLHSLKGVLAYCHGDLRCELDRMGEEVQVIVTLPITSNSDAQPVETYQEQLEELSAHYSFHMEPAMQEISFDRRVLLDSGALKSYEVTTNGAALLSTAARSQLQRFLSRADDYMCLFSDFHELSLSATGSARTIDEAYQTGDVDIMLRGHDSLPVKLSRAYSYVNDTFSWEEKSGIPRRSSWAATNSHCYLLTFSPTTFFDD